MAKINSLGRSALQQSGFDGGLRRFATRVGNMEASLLPRVGELMLESITRGSPLTGAPGQAVEDGDLLTSWKLALTPTRVTVLSDAPHAKRNEDGVMPNGHPYLQHSPQGGRHSVKLTRRGLQRIVDYAADETMRRA